MKAVSFSQKLSLPAALAVTIGAVIGVGIFVIVGPIGARCGGTMPLAFLVASLPAIFGTLVSIALGGTIPADGGGFFYTRTLLGLRPGIFASFLVTLGAFGALGAVSIGVADYLRIYFPGAPRWSFAVGLVLLSYGVNLVGILASSWFQILMVAQLASCLLIIVGVGAFSGGAPELTAAPPAGWGLAGFTGGAILAALAYLGFNIIGELGDEVENPRRNIPIAITVGLAVIILCYVGVAWVTAGNLSVPQMKGSRVALMDAALLYLPGWFKHYMTIAALAGAVTSINAVFLAVPRELTALAEADVLPRWLLRFDERRQTFTNALLVVLGVSLILVLTDLDVDQFGLIAVCGLMLLNALIAAGSFRLLSRFPEQVARAAFPIRAGWLFPCAALTLLTSGAFGLLAIVEQPLLAAVVVLLLILALVLGRSGRSAAPPVGSRT